MKVQDFANAVRERKPEYSHMDDVSIIQMVGVKNPALLEKNIDPDEMKATVSEIQRQKVVKARQEQFKSSSFGSRFGTGVERLVGRVGRLRIASRLHSTGRWRKSQRMPPSRRRSPRAGYDPGEPGGCHSPSRLRFPKSRPLYHRAPNGSN